jgi:hypothetical protein
VQWLRSQRLWLDLVGLLITAILSIVAFNLNGPTQELIIGVATSFIFVSLLDLLVASQDRVVNRARLNFFAGELIREQTTMVYPDFVMHDDVKATLASHNQQMLFQRPSSRFHEFTTHRIDIPRTVAANDIQALLYVASAFESTVRSPNVIVVDSAIIDDCNRSFISFGLSSNDCTHLYINEAPRPLFEIVEDGEGSEFVRLRNGKEYRSDARRQYGLILRHAPDLQENPQRRWLFVAGLGPVGTTAAGWYLSRHWQSLARRVERQQNFIAMVSTGPYTDRVPHLEEILIDE